MDSMTISDERVQFTIELLTSMVVEELTRKTGRPEYELLVEFMRSKTGKLLYDKEARLWWNGPAYIAMMYEKEMDVFP